MSEGAKPPLRRRALRWALEGLALVVIVLAIGAWQARGAAQGPAPPFAVQALTGGVVDVAALQGKPAVVVFWAPWCGVCRLQSKNVSRARAWLGDRAHVVSVASEYQDLASVRAYVERHEVDYPVGLGGADVARDYGVRAFPTAFVLDEDGNIRHVVVGYTTTLGLLWRVFI